MRESKEVYPESCPKFSFRLAPKFTPNPRPAGLTEGAVYCPTAYVGWHLRFSDAPSYHKENELNGCSGKIYLSPVYVSGLVPATMPRWSMWAIAPDHLDTKKYASFLFRLKYEEGCLTAFPEYYDQSQLNYTQSRVVGSYDKPLKGFDPDSSFEGLVIKTLKDNPPMDGKLKKKSWFFQKAPRWEYTPGPKDVAWVQERNREYLKSLIKQSMTKPLDDVQRRELSRLERELPNLATAAREEYAPLRVAHIERQKAEAVEKEAKRKAEIQQQKEREIRQQREAKEKQSLELNKSLHALFNQGGAGASVRAIQSLLERGADIDYQAPQDRYTALMLAADANDIKAADYLLKQGANPLITNKFGQKASDLTPQGTLFHQLFKNSELLFSARSNNLAGVRAALRGGDINHQDTKGNTALMLAVKANHKSTIKVLLQSGADVSITNDEGISAAMLTSDPEIRRWLMPGGGGGGGGFPPAASQGSGFWATAPRPGGGVSTPQAGPSQFRW